MADIFRTLIVTASDAPLARSIAASYGPGGEGMWTTALSETGEEPASHYVSSGYIPEQFATLLDDPTAVYNAAVQAGINCTEQDVLDLFNTSDVTEEDPFVAFERLNVKIVQPTNPL